MKNIILVTIIPLWSMNNKSGGKALYNTVSEYASKGYNIFFVTDQQNDYSDITNIKPENINFIDVKYNKSKNKYLNMLKTYKYFKKFEKQSYKKICEIINKIGTNQTILYAYEVNAVKSVEKVSKKYKIPFVTRFQGTIMANVKNNLYYKVRKYPHIQALSTKSNLVIMTDDGTQGDMVLDSYKNHSPRLFLRNGVNILDQEVSKIDKKTIKKEFGIQDNQKILLTVSRLEGWKHVERAIYALDRISSKENYFLIIVGDGSERNNLEILTKKLNLSAYVKFLGAVPNSDVNRFMQLADIFLSFYDLSNVGNPLLEALCLGKPIITYNVGDTYKIINGNNGILLDDVSPETIANSIEIMSDIKNLSKYSKSALDYAHKNLYSWKKRMEIEIEQVDKLF